MNAVITLFSSAAWTNAVFGLLHSIWLGALCVGLLAWALRGLGNDPEKRYRAGLLALGLLVASTLVAWSVQERGGTIPKVATTEGHGVVSREAEALGHATETAQPGRLSVASPSPATTGHHIRWIPWAAAFWTFGLVVMLGRVAVQLLASQRIRRSGQIIRDGLEARELNQLRARLGIRRVIRVARSALVEVPSVIGIVSPVILLPASMMSGIPAEQLRAILLHELAHIRRHDYLINILQQVIEAILFFNPAVWWINRQIRLEREACCDAMAVRVSEEPRNYAEALATFADRACRRRDAVLAFPGDRKQSTVLERMRRLLVPQYSPVVRLPWYSLCSVLILAGLLLFGAWRGTRLAVAVAAEILTPEERIEKIANIKAAVAPEEQIHSEDDRILVAGEVRTADGGPLPEDVILTVTISSSRRSFNHGGVRLKNGRFSREFEFGAVQVVAAPQSEYAPAFVGPLHAKPGGSITNIVLVLERGFSAPIRVIDPKGRPLAGVELEGRYEFSTMYVPIKLVTDADGEATVPHCAGAPMQWTARRKGFEASVQKDVRLRAEEPFVWKLQTARVTEGQVVSSEDGTPVDGAVVKMIHRSGGAIQDFESAPVVGRTDASGRFTLDTLPSGGRHLIAVHAEGFATTVRKVTAGQQLSGIELRPAIVIQGTIEGDLSTLSQNGGSVIMVGTKIAVDDSGSHVHNRNVPVEIRDGIGHFIASNIWEGELLITAGEQEFEFKVDKSRDDLVLKLPTAKDGTEREATRQVVVRFKAPGGAPAVKGQLEVWRLGERNPSAAREWIAVTNGEARFEASVGGWISWENGGLIGYWTPGQIREQVPAGSEPFVLEVDAIPAGAIHGRVLDPGGQETGGALLTVLEVEPAPGKQPGSLGEVGKSSAAPGESQARFLAQPLPLGGEYIIYARKGSQWGASDVIRLTPESPIREVELRLLPAQELTGFVTDVLGKPLAGIPVRVDFTTPYGMTFGVLGYEGSTGVSTDEQGRFIVAGINSQIPGTHIVSFVDSPGFKPKRTEVNPGEELRIALEPGQKLNGIVVNDASGKPLEGVTLLLMPAVYEAGGYPTSIKSDGRSDNKGRFQFTRLDAREYTFYCPDAAVITPVRVRPGAKEIELRIQPRPGARFSEAQMPIAAESPDIEQQAGGGGSN